MPIPLSQHAHFTQALKPWYTRVRPWKFFLIVVALIWFMVAQSEVINMPEFTHNAAQIWQEQVRPQKKKTEKPKPKPKKTVITPQYAEAVDKAQNYADSMHLSEEALRDELTVKDSHYSQDIAQYAIERIHADYPENALFQARGLEDQGVKDPAMLMKRLTSAEFKFTPADCEYALRNLFPDDIVNSVLSREH
ncbi:hypothetical protein KIMH_05260 [Bombiscardovia apis]|uniref:Putative host cell surface-exposed lipoprotein Ltp-like HTH region domain-containing protein n=1 Tax=Bombiscardovia apis TaxID=2932182 RepID=A0ABM8BC43_9BIFI|nr:Ltp family lipoprotein [Bombiscardovia apis]BDR54415.1 hypothetical protein KIMH_05260 [Bombiscardovia apis]